MGKTPLDPGRDVFPRALGGVAHDIQAGGKEDACEESTGTTPVHRNSLLLLCRLINLCLNFCQNAPFPLQGSPITHSQTFIKPAPPPNPHYVPDAVGNPS